MEETGPPFEDVRSTKTLFVLKQYKQSGIVIVDQGKRRTSIDWS